MRYVCLAVFASGMLSAAPVTWYLSGVTLSGGGKAVGSFTYDATANTYSNINIMTTPGTTTTSGGAQTGGKNYTAAAVPAFSAANQFLVPSSTPVVPGFTTYMVIDTTAPLTDTGGTVAIVTALGTEGFCTNAACSSIGAGSRSSTGGKLVALPNVGPKTWYLNRVVFDDGGQAAGSFTYDVTTNTYTNVDVWTTSGSTFATPVHYTAAKVAPGTRVANAGTAGFVTRNPALANDRIVMLGLTANMSNLGGTISVGSTPGETTCGDVGCDTLLGVSRQVTSGTITTVKPVGYTKILSDIVDGGGFQTSVQLTNLTDVPVSYTISFFTDAGVPYNVPGIGTGAAVTVPARGSSSLTSSGGSALTQGWARVDGADNFNASAVFKLSGLSIGAVENSVFGEPVGATSVSFPFDNTGGAVGGLALTNSNPTRAITVLAVAFDQTGTLLTNDTSIILPANGHTAITFGTGAGAAFSSLLNQKGVLRLFAIPSGGDAPAPFYGVNGLLLKFLPNLTNTTVQGIHQ